MLSRTLSKPLSACRNYRMLADVMFSFLQQQLLPQAILVFYPPSVTQRFECLFKLGQPLEVIHYPDDFWTWAAQFDSSDSLIPFATNPCQWNYKQLIAEETYLFTLDNHNERRTYLVLEGVNEQRVAQMMAAGELECLHLLAARWQCIRAETDAATEFKLRDR